MTMYFTDADNRIKNGGLPSGKGMTVYEYVEKVWLPAAEGTRKNDYLSHLVLFRLLRQLVRPRVKLRGYYPGVDQEDVTQEACYELWLRILELPEIFKSLPGYLKKHLHYWFLNYCRGLNLRKYKHEPAILSEQKRKLLDGWEEFPPRHPETIVLYDERSLLIRQLVYRLPPVQSRIIFYFFFQDLKVVEISQLMQLPCHTVRHHKRKALARLRGMFNRHGISPQLN